MIEKVARAMRLKEVCAASGMDTSQPEALALDAAWPTTDFWIRDKWLFRARAALEAMREAILDQCCAECSGNLAVCFNAALAVAEPHHLADRMG